MSATLVDKRQAPRRARYHKDAICRVAFIVSIEGLVIAKMLTSSKIVSGHNKRQTNNPEMKVVANNGSVFGRKCIKGSPESLQHERLSAPGGASNAILHVPF